MSYRGLVCISTFLILASADALSAQQRGGTTQRQTRGPQLVAQPVDKTQQRSPRRNPTSRANTGRANTGRASNSGANIRAADNRAAANRAAAARRAPVLPDGFPLTKEKQARVDRILAVWEQRTGNIKTHQVKFDRTTHNLVFGKQTLDRGVIRYRAPDKGLMRVNKVYDIDPKETDPKKKYVAKDVQFGEYWVCDGGSVFQLDSRTKTLTETQLPPDLRGKSIGEGPLPFMFGAKAETMKKRYWIREVTPPSNPNGDFFLEAIPKRREDAANFDTLLVKLSVDGKYLFPTAMRLTKDKQSRVEYIFTDHVPDDQRHRVADFLKHFVNPKTPRGWTKVVENWDGQQVQPRQASRTKTAQ